MPYNLEPMPLENLLGTRRKNYLRTKKEIRN